jgi:hypothetical protein
VNSSGGFETIIKRKWLTTYDKMASPPDDRIVMSWDIALSEIESGDYSACVVLLIRKEIVYILEVVRGRFPFETLKRKVMELKRRYSPSTLLIEDSPISLGLIQSLREQSINVTTSRHRQARSSAGAKTYGDLLNLCVWVKSNGGMGSLYRSQHELVGVFKNGKARHRNNVELGRHGRNRTNVWTYPGVAGFGRQNEEGVLLSLHPTVKPVALVADAILDCSGRGDLVLDAFLGSGTTLIAAERTGRTCYGIELDPLYVDTIIRRWQAYAGEIARHAVSGQSFAELAEERGGQA